MFLRETVIKKENRTKKKTAPTDTGDWLKPTGIKNIKKSGIRQ